MSNKLETELASLVGQLTKTNDDSNAKPIPPMSEGLRVSWTQAICLECWNLRFPSPPSTSMRHGVVREQCCDCGRPTTDGIYLREDPMTVRFPRVVNR